MRSTSVPGEVQAEERHRKVTELLHRYFDMDLIGHLQSQVLQLVACGYTDESVAKKLDVTSRTVQRHVAKTMALFGARSRLELGILLADQSAEIADCVEPRYCHQCGPRAQCAE